jgi:hypothetical protein
MKRLLVVLAIVVAVVVIGAVIFLFTGLDAAIKAVVESVGSDATQTAVRLESVHVGLTSGEGTLEGLTVANPKGYTAKYAFELGKIHVRIEPSSVASDVVVVPEILIDAPHVTVEVGTGGTNVGILQDNVMKYGSSDKAHEPSAVEKAKAPAGTERRYAVGDLRIRNVRIDVSASQLGTGSRGATIPEIRVRDIGGKKGATSGELATAILGALTRETLAAVGQSALESGIDKLKDKGLDLLKKKLR